MEDFKTIIYLIAALAAVITAVSNKKRKDEAARRAAKKPADAPASPWDGLDEATWGGEETDFSPMESPVSQPTPEIAYAEGKSLKSRKFQEGTYTEGGRAKPKITAPEPAVSEPRDENNLLEEFDLRQAVIYSEILKPKFEES